MAVRLRGVTVPDEKQAVIALTYLHGVGRTTAEKFLKEAGVAPEVRLKELSEAELAKLREAIDRSGLLLEGDLRRQVSLNVRRLREIGSYRGERHKNSLPARGQRTKTNARTRRGKKVTVGSGRKKATAKT